MIKTVTINPSLDRYYDVEHIELDGLHRILKIDDKPGGKGINAARVLKEVGCESVVYGFIGGANGEALEKLCDNLNTQLIRISNPTRVNHKYHDISNNAITEFNESGPIVSEKELKILEHCLSRDVFDNEWVVLGGSAPRGVADDVYVRLISIIQKRNGKVLLSCDTPWINNGIKALPNAVKLNYPELTRLAGKEFDNYQEIVEYVRTYISTGIELFIVSMAQKGALYVSANEAIHAHLDGVEVINDVGAGDAMLAGIIKCLSEDAPLQKIATFSIACASAAINNEEISVGNADNVERFEKIVETEMI